MHNHLEEALLEVLLPMDTFWDGVGAQRRLSLTVHFEPLDKAFPPTPSDGDLDPVVQLVRLFGVLGVLITRLRTDPIVVNDEVIRPGISSRIEQSAPAAVECPSAPPHTVAAPAQINEIGIFIDRYEVDRLRLHMFDRRLSEPLGAERPIVEQAGGARESKVPPKATSEVTI